MPVNEWGGFGLIDDPERCPLRDHHGEHSDFCGECVWRADSGEDEPPVVP